MQNDVINHHKSHSKQSPSVQRTGLRGLMSVFLLLADRQRNSIAAQPVSVDTGQCCSSRQQHNNSTVRQGLHTGHSSGTPGY